MKGVNFVKRLSMTKKKVVRNFGENRREFFKIFCLKINFPKIFVPPNICDPNFCPPIFMTSLCQWHQDGKFEIVTFCQLYSSYRVVQYNISNKRIFYALQYLYRAILLKMRYMGPNLRKCLGVVIVYSAILFLLQLHLSHSHTKYVKRQVIS